MIVAAELPDELWSAAPGATPERIVEATRAAGAERAVLPIQSTDDPWAVVHPTERVTLRDGTELALSSLDLGRARRETDLPTLTTLEQVLLALHKAGLGAVLRLADTRPIGSVDAALGVTGGEGRPALLPRFLVTVPDRRVGRRLRADAPQLPSALELARPHDWRGRLALAFPNLARANADADDLVVPWDLFPPARLATLSSQLARRGGRVFLSGVPRDALDSVRDHQVAGVLLTA